MTKKTYTIVLAFILLAQYNVHAQDTGQKQEPGKNNPAKKIAIKKTDLADEKDLVCGMQAFRFLKDTAVVNNKIYGFCSQSCKKTFKESPDKYMNKKKNK